MKRYIYDYPTWPNFTWNEAEIQPLLGKIRLLQGQIIGRMSSIGFSLRSEALLGTLTLDVLNSSEIEGELLDHAKVRSSIARRLGMEQAGLTNIDRNVEGVVEMMLDATQKFNLPLTHDRLYAWHAALFPTGWSGLQKIETGRYRTGEMQIVSGAMGKEKIHYHAPAPSVVKKEMDRFLSWFESDANLDGVIKAAIAHFWFIIIHPFDDGNGRIARALSDLLLARSEGSSQRYYSMSSQILIDRKSYYEILQKVQHGKGDITAWMVWFLNCLHRALLASGKLLEVVVFKAEFWEQHKDTPMNTRQRLMVNKLLDGIDGKLKTSKWAKMSKCSTDTALRDITDLLEKNILKKEREGGRSTNYELRR